MTFHRQLFCKPLYDCYNYEGLGFGAKPRL